MNGADVHEVGPPQEADCRKLKFFPLSVNYPVQVFFDRMTGQAPLGGHLPACAPLIRYLQHVICPFSPCRGLNHCAGPFSTSSSRGGAASGRVALHDYLTISTCADSGAQALRSARATVPPSLRESSSRVSSLLACYALGPPASAAQYSCRREPCTGRSAWLPLGRACLSAWIEHRIGEHRSP